MTTLTVTHGGTAPTVGEQFAFATPAEAEARFPDTSWDRRARFSAHDLVGGRWEVIAHRQGDEDRLSRTRFIAR